MERPFQSMVFLRPMENKWVFQKPFFNGNVPLPEIPWVITSCHQNGTLLYVRGVRRRGKPVQNIFMFHHRSLGEQENFCEKHLPHHPPPHFCKNIYGEIKRQEEIQGRRSRQWVSWPHQLPGSRSKKSAVRQDFLTFPCLFDSMTSTGCGDCVDPGVPSVPQASRQMLRWSCVVFSGLLR